jgi:4-alpha-glucanotransferase
VATSGTHDTETLAVWWDSLDVAEREAILRLPTRATLASTAHITARGRFNHAIRDLLLELLFASGSDLLILPVQDVFGWRDRINVPALVSDDNWTWRLPWPSDQIRTQHVATERASTLRQWAERHGRRNTGQRLTIP